MLKAANYESDNWIDDVEWIKKFPIEDLQIIDCLWVEYSNGKYGFSVQKKVWQECGSPKTYGSEWCKFGERVGWRQKNKWGYNWISYNSLIFQPGSSPYTLPVTPSQQRRWYWKNIGWALRLLSHPAFKP